MSLLLRNVIVLSNIFLSNIFSMEAEQTIAEQIPVVKKGKGISIKKMLENRRNLHELQSLEKTKADLLSTTLPNFITLEEYTRLKSGEEVFIGYVFEEKYIFQNECEKFQHSLASNNIFLKEKGIKQNCLSNECKKFFTYTRGLLDEEDDYMLISYIYLTQK